VSNVSDKIHLVDAKTAAATVAWSKEIVISATRELERHELWLERHHEVYSEALKQCQRQLKRHYLISACKQTALLPIQLLASGCVALFRGVRPYPRRSRLRADLQNRIDRMEQRRRFVDPDLTSKSRSRGNAVPEVRLRVPSRCGLKGSGAERATIARKRNLTNRGQNSPQFHTASSTKKWKSCGPL
jgi:hypothetical protein